MSEATSAETLGTVRVRFKHAHWRPSYQHREGIQWGAPAEVFDAKLESKIAARGPPDRIWETDQYGHPW